MKFMFQTTTLYRFALRTVLGNEDSALTDCSAYFTLHVTEQPPAQANYPTP